MTKLLMSILIFIFPIISVTAQINDVLNALSRLDTAVENSEVEFTPQDSYYIGRAAAAHILDRYPLYTAKPDLTNYLNMICSAIAINSQSPHWYNGYYVAILDTPVLNAFSTPGGHIFISLGLVELSETEDMLAALIAHELAHIQLKHGIENIRHDRVVQELNREQARISGVLGAQQRDFALSVNELVETLLGKGYSQTQEFEADTLALNLLASAGYNPHSLIDLLRIFERTSANHAEGLNISHPLPAHRITRVEQQAGSYRFTEINVLRRNRFNRLMER